MRATWRPGWAEEWSSALTSDRCVLTPAMQLRSHLACAHGARPVAPHAQSQARAAAACHACRLPRAQGWCGAAAAAHAFGVRASDARMGTVLCGSHASRSPLGRQSCTKPRPSARRVVKPATVRTGTRAVSALTCIEISSLRPTTVLRPHMHAHDHAGATRAMHDQRQCSEHCGAALLLFLTECLLC